MNKHARLGQERLLVHKVTIVFKAGEGESQEPSYVSSVLKTNTNQTSVFTLEWSVVVSCVLLEQVCNSR